MVLSRGLEEQEVWKKSIQKACGKMPEKAEALNAILEGTSGNHQWTLTNHPRPTFCNYCREKLSGVPWHGYTCDICKVKAHRKCTEKILDRCKWTSESSIPQHLQYINPENSIVPHQWVEGNLPKPAKCIVCEKPCGSVRKLQDWRCLWCACCVHSDCLSQLGRGCSLGSASLSVIPPLSLREVTPDGIAVLREDAYGGECGGGSPLIVLINSKSGDSQGQRIIKKFRRLLNPCQVFDIITTGPEFALTFFSQLESFRVVVCGGDGTVGWVLSAFDKLNLHSKCQLAILPLGTGNDLARVLGWGHAFYDDAQLPQLVRTLERAHTKMLDRWSILSIEGPQADAVRRYEDVVIEKVRAVMGSEQVRDVIVSVTSLCSTIRELIESIAETYAKVEEWEREEGKHVYDPMTLQCSTLLGKLDRLMRSLKDDVNQCEETDLESGVEVDGSTNDRFKRRDSIVNRANSLKRALRDVIWIAERGIDQHYRESACTKREHFRKKRSKTTPSVLKINHLNKSSSSSICSHTCSGQAESSGNLSQIHIMKSDKNHEIDFTNASIGTVLPPTPGGSREPSAVYDIEGGASETSSTTDRPRIWSDSKLNETEASGEDRLHPKSGDLMKISHSDSSLYETAEKRSTEHSDKMSSGIGGDTVSIRTNLSGKEGKRAARSETWLSSTLQRSCRNMLSGFAGGSLIAEVLLLNARVLSQENFKGDECQTPFNQYKETCVMNNYFGIGLDAKIALEFHNKREESSDKTRSRSKLFLWYGMLGGKELVHRTYRNLDQRIKLECDGVPIDLPSLQGIVILNIPSYSGGANFWGRGKDDSFTVQSFDDRVLEVVALFGVIHVATSRVPNVVRLQNHRIAQCRHVRIVILGDEPIPVQVDGEPWLQPPGIMQIVHKNRAQMLARNPIFDATLKKWEEQKEKSSSSITPTTPTALYTTQEDVPFVRRAAAFLRLVETEIAQLGVSSAFLEALDEAALLVRSGGTSDEEEEVVGDLEDREEILAAVERVIELLEDHFGIPERAKSLTGQPRLGPAPNFNCEIHGDDPENWRYVINCVRQEMDREEQALRDIRQQEVVGVKTKRNKLAGWLSKKFGHKSSTLALDNISSWSVDQVCTWLASIGLQDYVSQFKSNDIQGSELIHLERGDIQELGVKKIGHVKRLQSAIEELRAREVERRRRNSKKSRSSRSSKPRGLSAPETSTKMSSLSAERTSSTTSGSGVQEGADDVKLA